MNEISHELLPSENTKGYSVKDWISEVENIFKLMPKVKDKVIDYLIDNQQPGSNKFIALKVNINGKRKKFEITIKMSD